MAGAVCQVRLIYLRYNIMMRWLQQQQNRGSKFESQDSKTSQHCILAHLCSRHIHQIASSLFSALAKGATKHLQRSPHNCQPLSWTIFLMMLGPLKHDKSVARLHFCLFTHIILQAKATCLHAMTNVLEIRIFPQLDKFWKMFSTLSSILEITALLNCIQKVRRVIGSKNLPANAPTHTCLLCPLQMPRMHHNFGTTEHI